MTPYEIDRTHGALSDFVSIFQFLTKSYMEFGDNRRSAEKRAFERVRRMETAMLALGRAPHQGTLQPQLGPSIRSVTKDRAVFYFEADDDTKVVRVLAIFYGGQDHQRQMLKRLLAR